MTQKRKKKFSGSSSCIDRHGKLRWRYRKGAFSTELGTDFGSREFVRRYNAAVSGAASGEGAGIGKTIPFSISALISQYYQTADFKQLADSTKATYRNTLEGAGRQTRTSLR